MITSTNLNILNTNPSTSTAVQLNHQMIPTQNSQSQLQSGHGMIPMGQMQSKPIIQQQLDATQQISGPAQQQSKLPMSSTNMVAGVKPITTIQNPMQINQRSAQMQQQAQPTNQLGQLGQNQLQMGQNQQLGYPNYSYTTDYCGNR